MSSALSCYSVRQLSPFIGTIQIVEADYCRALSSDGDHWQIQASCELHQQEWNVSGDEYIPRRYVLYGSWSHKQGFSSLPLDPMLDVPSPEHVQRKLVRHLPDCHQQLPFAPRDYYECWLIDQHSELPLALVASATEERIIPHIQYPRWQAIPAQDTEAHLHLPEDTVSSLEQHINQQGRFHAWYRRTKDGGMHPLQTDAPGLKPVDFPELPLNQRLLPEALHPGYQRLIDWQSPRLLTLPWLSESCRLRLTQLAKHHALETRRRWNLYPQPLPQDIINKICVELKIRGL